mmetsp:Transcript_7670/g.8127  ORF Transcript_7670/g.8127 Transcript_7670/m.8127 type:complete len:198 (+) Transcript_7670:1558-2151(+)
MKRIQSQSLQDRKDNVCVESESEKKPFVKKEIPITQLNTLKLTGLDQKLQQMKIVNHSYDFKEQIDQILSLYDESELHYSDKLVLYVMGEVEKYILKSKSGESKKKLVIEVCKSYFNNDPEFVEMVINLVFKKLKQIQFIKRQAYKVLKFFQSQTKSTIRSVVTQQLMKVGYNSGIVSKRVLMYYEAFDLLHFLKYA